MRAVVAAFVVAFVALALCASTADAIVVGPVSTDLETDFLVSYRVTRTHDGFYTRFSPIPPIDGEAFPLFKTTADVVCGGTLGDVTGKAVYVKAGTLRCSFATAVGKAQALGARGVLLDAGLEGPKGLEALRVSPPGSTSFAPYTAYSYVIVSTAQIDAESDGTLVTFFMKPAAFGQLDGLTKVYNFAAGDSWLFSHSVDGVPWNVDSNSSDPCRDHWERVTCLPTGHVSQLFLNSMGLVGRLPDELSNLTNIEAINLSENKLAGSIPDSLGFLLNLRVLNLAFNSLTDKSFPPTFAFLPLEVVDLSGNLLSGSLTDFVLPTAVLKILRLANNQLTGTIDSAMTTYSLLTELVLSRNKFSGDLPAGFFAPFLSATQIDISQNELTGTVPLTNLPTTLTLINVGLNKFTAIQADTGASNLEFFLACCNSFAIDDLSGLPSVMWPRISRVDLSRNKFDGAFDATTLLPATVPSIDLSRNAITSFKSAAAGHTSIDLSRNKLTSVESLISGLAMPEFLRSLDVSNNDLTYRFTVFPLSIFASFEQLESLDLSANTLSGSLYITREDNDRLTKLVTLDMSKNNFTGAVSDLFGRFTSLTELDLSGNPSMRRTNGPGKLVPSFVTPIYDVVDTTSMPNAACPSFESPSGALVFHIDHSYHYFRLCTCRDGFFNTTTECLKCPENAECVGHPTVNTGSFIVAEKGYFPIDVFATMENIYFVEFDSSDKDVAEFVSDFGNSGFFSGFSSNSGGGSGGGTTNSGTTNGGGTYGGGTYGGGTYGGGTYGGGTYGGGTYGGSTFSGYGSGGSGSGSGTTGPQRRALQLRLDSKATVGVPIVADVVGCRFGAMREDNKENPCNPEGNSTSFSCATGSTGFLCSECIDGYFSRNGLCIKCSASKGAFPAIFVFAIFIVVGVSALLVAIRDTIPPIERVQMPMYVSDEKKLAAAGGLEEQESVSEQQQSESSVDEAEIDAAIAAADDDEKANNGSAQPEVLSRAKRVKAFLQTRRFRSLRLFVISIIAVLINFSQTLTITMADATLPSSVLPVFQGTKLFESRPDTSGVGFECVDELKTYRSRYMLLMLVPAGVLAFVLILFTVKFALTYRAKRALLEARMAAELNVLIEASESGDLTETDQWTRDFPSTSASDTSATATSDDSSLATSDEDSEQQECANTGVIAVPPIAPNEMFEKNAYMLRQTRNVAIPSSWFPIYMYQCVYFFLVVINYFMLPVSTFILNGYQCREIAATGESYVKNLPYLSCDHISHAEKIIPLLVYTLTPIVMLLLGLAAIELRHTWYFANMGFGLWFDAFRSKHRYFSLLFILRKLGIAMLVALVDEGQIYRHVLLVVNFVLSAFFVFQKRPYFFEVTNLCDVVAHCALIVCYAVSLVTSDDSSVAEAAVAGTIWLLAVIFALLFIGIHVLLAFYRVLWRGEWHDEHTRKSAIKRVSFLYRMWYQHGVSPLLADA